MDAKQVITLVDSMYGLSISDVRKSSVGAGSDTFFLSGKDGEFVLKYPSESEMNHPEAEPKLCEYLLNKAIPVCQFLKNKQDSYLSQDEQGRVFHLQRFIKGKMYEWNTAEDWLMKELACTLGKIHKALANYRGLPEGIGAGFFQYMTPQNALNSYQESLQTAIANHEKDYIEDLRFRIELMERFPDWKISCEQLTRCSTHGDYFISQILCGENQINAVIDWTTACVHPVVWEIMRSFVYANPGCATGEIDAKKLTEYVSHYMEYAPLSPYDISMLVKVFYYQIAVCDYYGQYYRSTAANRSIYLEQAILSTKVMRWLDLHEAKLSEYLYTNLKRD